MLRSPSSVLVLGSSKLNVGRWTLNIERCLFSVVLVLEVVFDRVVRLSPSPLICVHLRPSVVKYFRSLLSVFRF